MSRESKFLSSLVLLAALVAPATILAKPVAQEEHRERERERDRDRDHDRDKEREHRYYDKAHRDYHQWNANEDTAYRRWMAERHRKYMEFGRLSAGQQQAYWKWRHSHPDAR